MYYRGAAAAVIVYDVTDPQSFANAQAWVDELKREVGPVPMALAGNKCDLSGRAVSHEEATAYAESQGLIFMETSAKEGTSVADLFEALVSRIPKSRVGGGGRGGCGNVNLKQQQSTTSAAGCCS